MTYTPVAGDIHEALDTQLDLGTQFTFYLVFILNLPGDVLYLVIGPLAHFGIFADTYTGEDVFGGSRSDAIDIGQAYDTPFISWQIYSSNTSHNSMILSLTLFKFRVFLINDIKFALPADKLAICCAFLN